MSAEKAFQLLSVAGYLQLPDKPGGRVKKRWCWFDERTCSLKYYKDQTSYGNRIDEPLGEIKLASAKITPPLIDITDRSSNQFQISTDEGLYQLQAKDNKEALEWIRKLQDKRSEYHNIGSAREHHDVAAKPGANSDSVAETSKLNKLLGGSPQTSPVGVRKIMQQILSPRRSMVSLCPPMSDQEASRRLSGDTDEVDGTCLVGDLPLSWSHFGGDTTCSDAPDDSAQCVNIPTAGELKLEYYKSQETSTMYYKELQKLKQKLEQRDMKIHALSQEIVGLKEKISSMSVPVQIAQLQEEKANLDLTLKQLLETVKVFGNEVDQHKQQSQLNEKKILTEKERSAELEKNINNVKKKYVQVLAESLLKTLLSVHDNTETSRNPRLVELLEEEGWETEGVFEDEYGDIHDWNTDTNVQHFLCRCLYLHYTQHEQEALAAEWEAYFVNLSKTLSLTLDWSKKEFRDLLRKGLPATYRKEVWATLVYRHVARIREVKDHASGGVSYYQALLNSSQQCTCRKQIDLDLHRTMPSNKFFRRGGSGIKQLENVLIAYSIHNKNIGYCQGMNMIAALGLLFLEEEATFWYMVAIIEKLVPIGYYGTGLLGAQADQAVLQEVLVTQIPDLHEHFAAFGIEIKLVTFNWFLTLFIDAIPMEGALRIMDSFLNEGHKVMYRVAIGILKVYKEHFLGMVDPVSLFQSLKEIIRHTYTIEDIFNVAFTREFPSRSHLTSRHSYHLNLFRQEWEERRKEAQVYKEATAATIVRPPPLPSIKKDPQWECGCSFGTDEICLCSGERDQGIIAVITVRQESRMQIVPDTVMKGRAVCMKYVSSCDIVLIGTLDFYVYAVDCLTWKELWSLKLIDSVLNIEAIESTVFFALAEGSVAIIKNIDRTCPLSEPLLLRIGSSSVPCLALVPNQMLWCGSEKSITVLSTVTCELEKSIVIDEDDDVGKIYKMRCGQEGIWVTFKSSTIICLFDVNQYTKLLQVDYATLPTSETHDRITSLLPVQGHLWVGTGDGTIHILSVKARESAQREVHTSLQADAPGNLKRLGRYTSGGLVTRREDGVDGSDQQQQLQTESRRKTKFGRTLLHRMKPKSAVEKVDAYELTIEASRHVGESRKEPVRTLQTCLGPDNTTIVVSSVHTDSDRAIQMWRCSDQNATNWDMVYLQCSEK